VELKKGNEYAINDLAKGAQDRGKRANVDQIRYAASFDTAAA